MKLEGLVFGTEVTIEVRNNFDETSHDKRKKADAAKHDENADYFFEIRNRVDIAVADSCEGSDGEITASDESLNSVKFVLV